MGRAPRDDEAGVPAGSAATGRRLDRVVEAAPDDQPGDQRIGVPHLACMSSSRPQNRRGYVRDQINDALRKKRVLRQPQWTLDRLVDVWDHAVAPAPDLVAEDAS